MLNRFPLLSGAHQRVPAGVRPGTINPPAPRHAQAQHPTNLIPSEFPTMDRREFFQQSAMAGAGSYLLGGARAFARSLAPSPSPNEKVRFACIGVGGKGDSDTHDAGKHGEIVALCDTDENVLNRMAKDFPKAKKYFDYRKMLEELGSKIDAVTVSTPDHTHAPASVMAMRMGKHCFCQKPLTWSVEEARVMRTLAAEKKLCTQMGNQGTAEDGFRGGVELIQSGILGPIKEVMVWTNRPIWPQGIGRPKSTPGIPNHVHWYEFLGAAHDRPYHPDYQPFNWRGWLDFGTGALGDMACHTINVAAMAASSCSIPIRSKSSTPRASSIGKATRSGPSFVPGSDRAMVEVPSL